MLRIQFPNTAQVTRQFTETKRHDYGKDNDEIEVPEKTCFVILRGEAWCGETELTNGAGYFTDSHKTKLELGNSAAAMLVAKVK